MMGRASEERWAMLPNFDILRIDKKGALIWCGSSETFQEAKAKGEVLTNRDGKFVIFNQRTQERTTINVDKPDLPLAATKKSH
jgi:hypothetical protein